MPFASLLELLRPALGALDSIPEPQAEALAAALALRQGGAQDRFAIGAATLSLLAAYAEEAPLLLLVDDAHWLDGSSAEALLFAFRRLVADPIAVLIGVRDQEPSLIDGSDLPLILLEGLDRATAAELTGSSAPELADRLYEASGGNPLALLELAADSERLDAVPPGGPLPISTSIGEAFLRRSGSLPEETRRMLVVAAAAGGGRLSMLGLAASSLGLSVDALADAESAGLVTIAAGALEFHHPLVRSAVYGDADAQERRAAHAALAGALPDREVDRRAWHLAAAALGPDDAASAALQQAGDARPHTRRLHGGGRRLRARRAAGARRERASAAPVGRGRRRLERRPDRTGAGAARRGARVGARRAPRRPHRAPARSRHDEGRAAGGGAGDPRGGRRAGGRTESGAGGGDAGRSRARLLLLGRRGGDAAHRGARRRAGARGGQRPRALLRLDRDGHRAGDRGRRGGGGGEPARRGGDPRGLGRAARGSAPAGVGRAGAALAARGGGRAAALVDRALAYARERSAAGALPYLLHHVARERAMADSWPAGQAGYYEAVRLARESGQRAELAASLSGLAWLEGAAGDGGALPRPRRGGAGALQAARHAAVRDLDGDRARRAGAGTRPPRAGRGALRGAARAARGARRDGRRRLGDPRAGGCLPAPGSPGRCGRARAGARGTGPRQGAALVAGPRGALSRPRGAGQRAGRALRRGARASRAHARPVRGRPHAAGVWRASTPGAQARTGARGAARGARAVRPARRPLRGPTRPAPSWWPPARRPGGATRARSTSSLLRSCRSPCCLAEGKTTRQAAAALFLSPKTIEYHLRHVYSKLGIRSREQLAAAFTDRRERAVSPG